MSINQNISAGSATRTIGTSYNPETYEPIPDFHSKSSLKMAITNDILMGVIVIPPDYAFRPLEFVDKAASEAFFEKNEPYYRAKIEAQKAFERDMEEEDNFAKLPDTLKAKIHALAWWGENNER